MIKSLLLMLMFLLCTNSVFGASLLFKWKANKESDLAGYKIHTGIASLTYTKTVDVGNVTTYVMSDVTEGTTVFGAVSAYDTSGNESGYSKEGSATIPIIPPIDTTPPGVPETPTVIIIIP